MSDLMTMSEAAELAEAEQVIERGIKTFTEVGNALLKIRDGRLYRAEFGTFEDYCRERWGFRRQRANELITAALVVDEISSTGTPAPSNEAQAVALARVPEPERAEVWRETVERTNGKPTAAAIRETYRPAPAPEPSTDSVRQADGTPPPPEPGIWYGGPAEPEPAPVPAPTRSSSPPPMTEEQREERLRLVAKQEALNAWNQANDGLTAALSYAKTYSPPDDTDIYATVHDFKRRLKDLTAITENWRDAS